MGGEINVSSHPGEGSIFRFEINIEESHEEAMEKKTELRHVTGLLPGQKIRRVLIADDKQDNRVLLSQILGRIGFTVREVSDGEQAVSEFDKWRPDLILMDSRMPVMSGFEAIRLIRTSEGGKKVKIINVTASAFDEDRKKAIEVGADDFLGKPFREEVLLEKIKVLLAVEYVYTDASPALQAGEDAADELSDKMLAVLPETLISQLHDATLSADLDRMLELISLIEKLDVNIAIKMRSLTEKFDYPKLLEVTMR
jgi:CheY-like chemotaxis protein